MVFLFFNGIEIACNYIITIDINDIKKVDSMKEKILTIKETAQYLKMGTTTIYKLILKKNLPATKVANKWRIRKSKLDKWVDEMQYNNNKIETTTL